MLANTWTGGDARPVPYTMIRLKEGLEWVERAYLEGKLALDELMAYLAVVKGLPERFESDPEFDD